MKHILTTLALLAAPMASPAAHAQLDGQLGKSSTGSLTFSLNVNDNNRVQVYGFTDLVQSVEAGGRVQPFLNQSRSGSLPCITADRADTTVALDWAFTPLADTTDATNVIPVLFELYTNTSFGVDDGTQIVSLTETDSLTPQSGTVTGVPTKTGGHGTDCTTGSANGALELYYRRGSSQSSQRPQTAGTYVSTITITVRPE